jgi:MFS family permease
MTVQNARTSSPGSAVHPNRRAVYLLMPACSILVVSLVAAINLAIPKLSVSSLHPGQSDLLWIVDGYVLVFGCLLIPAGAAGDRYGRKGALLAGLATVAAGCLISAAAPDVGVLVAGRALTGVGAALVMPATLSLMLQVSAPGERAQAIATWTAATGVAGVAGNLAGGLILQYLPWEALFLAVAPIAALLGLASARYAPRGERHPARLDLVGAVLVTASAGALLYGIIEGPELGWSSGGVVGGLVASVALGAAFVGYDLRAEAPLLDPRLFRLRGLRAGSLGVAVAFFGLFALFFVNAQYMQYAKGFSPLGTGVAIAPFAIGMIVVSRRSIGWARRIGIRWTVAAGLASIVAGLLLLSLADAGTPYPLYLVFLLAMSIGLGLCLPSLSAAVMTSLPRSQSGLGSGLNGATREIGSALGVAAIGTIIGSRLSSGPHGGHGSVEAALRGAGPARHHQAVTAFTDAMAVGYRSVAVGVAVVGVLVLWWLRSSSAE